MGVFLTSACISLAISELTRSIWRSLQGSPPLPCPGQPEPSVAQIDSVATACPRLQSQSAPSVDPMQAPAIMSSLIWTCHTSPDTYPRHAVTFCPAGAEKHSRGFSLSHSLPLLPVVLFSLSFHSLLFSHAPSLLFHSFCCLFLPSISPTPTPTQFLAPCKLTCFSTLWPSANQTCVFVFSLGVLQAEETRGGLDVGARCQLCSIMHVSPPLTYELIDRDK